MKKYKLLIVILMIIMLCGCSKNPLETEKDTYWIDTKALESKDKILNRGGRTEHDASFGEFDSEFNRYAYQFMSNGKCKRITLGGTQYFKDDKITELFPMQLYPSQYSLDDNLYQYDISFNSLNIIKTKGIWTSDLVNCTYETKDDEITIKVNSCDSSIVQETIKGKYKLDEDKLKISWNKVEYKNGEYGSPDSNGNLTIKWNKEPYDKMDLGNEEIEYKNSKILDDIESITYKHDIELYMFYEVKEIEYDISDHEVNGVFYDSMTFGLWAKSVLQENNSNMDVNDFIFVNEWNKIDNRDLINGYNTTMGYLREKIKTTQIAEDNKISLYIPYKKYNNDEFKENVAKLYGTNKENVKIYACYSENEEYGGRQCYEYDNPLNKETDNYMDTLVEIENRTVPSYSVDGFCAIELNKEEIKKKIKEANSKKNSVWNSYEINKDSNICSYGEDK